MSVDSNSRELAIAFWKWSMSPKGGGRDYLPWWQAVLGKCFWETVFLNDRRPPVFRAGTKPPCTRIILNTAQLSDIMPTNGTTVIVSERVKLELEKVVKLSFQPVTVAKTYHVPLDGSVDLSEFLEGPGGLPINRIVRQFEVPSVDFTWFAPLCEWMEDLPAEDRFETVAYGPSDHVELWMSRRFLESRGLVWSRGMVCTAEVFSVIKRFLNSPHWFVGAIGS